MRQNRRVTVTWDLLRNTENSLPNVDFVNRWCLHLIRPTLDDLGIAVESVTTSAQGGVFPTAEFVRACGEEPGPSAWSRLFFRADLSRRAEEILKAHFTGELVVGAVPPFLALFLERQSIPFIDIDLDAVRFAREFFLRARTTSGQIARFFGSHEASASFLREEAGLLGGRLAWHGPQLDFGSARRVGLFIGQTEVDMSLFCGGVIAEPGDFIEEARSFFAACDLVLVSPHPHMSHVRNLEPVRRALSNALYCGLNTYVLLNDPRVTHVSGLSSSVLTEAMFFGKTCKTLIEADFFHLARRVKSLSPNYRISARTLLRALRECFGGSSAMAHDDDTAGYTLRESWNVNYSLNLAADRGFVRLVKGEEMNFRHTWPAREIFVAGWPRGDEHGVWMNPGSATFVAQAPGASSITLTLYAPTQEDGAGEFTVRVFSESKSCALKHGEGMCQVTVDVGRRPTIASGLIEVEIASPSAMALCSCRAD